MRASTRDAIVAETDAIAAENAATCEILSGLIVNCRALSVSDEVNVSREDLHDAFRGLMHALEELRDRANLVTARAARIIEQVDDKSAVSA